MYNTLMEKTWKRNLRAFILGQSISLFGSSLVQYAIMWHITLTTKSGTIMTLSIIAGFLPTLFLSPFAGIWADRYDRKRLIVLADGGIALVTLFTVIAYALGYGSIGLLLVISAVRALGSAIHGPSVNAFVPELVPEDQLMRIQGLNSGVQSAIMIISPIVSAFLLANFSLALIFSIDIITAILGIVTLLVFVKPITKRQIQEHSSYLKDLKSGIEYIRNHRFLIPFFVIVALVMFLIAPVAFLTTLQTVFKFGDAPWRLSAIEVAFASGMMLGGFALSRFQGFKNRIQTMAVSLGFMAILSIALSLSNNFTMYMLVMFSFGISIPYYNAPANVMIQEKVEANYLGRVFSVLGMISSSTMPLSMIIFGPLADVWSVDGIMIAAGIAMLVLTLRILTHPILMQEGLRH